MDDLLTKNKTRAQHPHQARVLPGKFKKLTRKVKLSIIL